MSTVYFSQTTFLYFGLKFLRFTVSADSDYGLICNPMKLEKAYPWTGWANFKSLINADIDCLNVVGIGAKLGRLQKRHIEPLRHTDPAMLVYHHTFHAVCSSVGFRQLREAGIAIEIKPIELQKCKVHARKNYDILLPFLCDNYSLELVYNERMNDTLEDDYDHYKTWLDFIKGKVFKCSGFFMNESKVY